MTVAVKCFALLAALVSVGGNAMAKGDVQIAVVPVHAKSNAAFDAAVNKLIDKPLKHHADVISASQFKAAAKKSHVKPMAMALPRNLKTVGRKAKATHVLIIEMSGKGKSATANTTLFDVSTGRTLLTDSYPLTGGKLTAEVATQILTPVLDAIGGAPAAKEKPAAEATEPTAEDDKPKAKMGKGFAFPGKEGDKEAGDKDADAEEGGDDAAAPAEAAAGGEEEGENAVEATAPKPARDTDDPHNTAFRVALGATFMQRNAHLTQSSGTGTLPCYCGTGNNSNPFFPAFDLAVEFFPMALKDPGAENWYDNLGVQADFFVTRVNSYVDTNPNDTIGSTIFNFDAGLIYRLNWWNSVMSPDTYFSLGYSMFSFPLASGAFPGVTYSAPYLGAQFHIPVGLEQIALVAGGAYQFAVTAGGDAATTLGKQSSGNAFNIGGGVRVSIDHFELSAMYRYQLYDLSYTGTTSLSARGTATTTVPAYTNVTLKDALNEVILMAAYRL